MTNKTTQSIKESYWQPEYTQKYSQFEPVPIFSENNKSIHNISSESNQDDNSSSMKFADTNESLNSNQSKNSDQIPLDYIDTNNSNINEDSSKSYNQIKETTFNTDNNQADDNMEIESKEIVVSHIKNMFLDVTSTEIVKTKSPEENNQCVIIDETIMSSSSSSSPSNSPQKNDQNISLSSPNSLESKNSNILDQNLDTLEELDSDDLDNKENVIIISNEEEEKCTDCEKEQSINYCKKRRKTIEEISLEEHLNEINSKRFKQNNNSLNSNFQLLNQNEIISIDEDVVDSDSDSCEIIEEIDKKTKNNQDNQAQVLKMIEKSFNQTRNTDDIENDNALGKFKGI
jgi:hypothetical protein